MTSKKNKISDEVNKSITFLPQIETLLQKIPPLTGKPELDGKNAKLVEELIRKSFSSQQNDDEFAKLNGKNANPIEEFIRRTFYPEKTNESFTNPYPYAEFVSATNKILIEMENESEINKEDVNKIEKAIQKIVEICQKTEDSMNEYNDQLSLENQEKVRELVEKSRDLYSMIQEYEGDQDQFKEILKLLMEIFQEWDEVLKLRQQKNSSDSKYFSQREKLLLKQSTLKEEITNYEEFKKFMIESVKNIENERENYSFNTKIKDFEQKIIKKTEDSVNDCDEKYLKQNIKTLKEIYNTQTPYVLGILNKTCNENLEHYGKIGENFNQSLKLSLKEEIEKKATALKNYFVKEIVDETKDKFESKENLYQDKKSQKEKELDPIEKELTDLEKKHSEAGLGKLIDAKLNNISQKYNQILNKEEQISILLNKNDEDTSKAVSFQWMVSNLLSQIANQLCKESQNIGGNRGRIQALSEIRCQISESYQKTFTKLDDEHFSKADVLKYCKKEFKDNTKLMEAVNKNGLNGEALIEFVQQHGVDDKIWEDLGLEKMEDKQKFHSFFSHLLEQKNEETRKEHIKESLRNLIDILTDKPTKKIVKI